MNTFSNRKIQIFTALFLLIVLPITVINLEKIQNFIQRAAGPPASSQNVIISSTPPPNLWPAIYHKVGSYGYPKDAQDAVFAKSIGINYFITSAGVTKYGVDVIATQIRGLIQKHWDLHCAHLPKSEWPNCSLMDANGNKTPEQLALEEEVKAFLPKVANDPHIIGHYILDDTPAGNFGGSELKYTLQEVHKLVKAENAKLSKPRFTLCAFDVDPRHSYNFSPEGCDLVGLYHYRKYDETPYFNNFYNDPRGFANWDANKQQLIGTGQTFTLPKGYATPPTADQVTQQTTGFCMMAAVSVAPYTWRQNGGTSDLATSTTYQDGFKKGIQNCRAIWAAGIGVSANWKPGTVLPPIPSPTLPPPPTPTTTATPTPTLTPIPTPTSGPTLTTSPNATPISLSVFLHGIGNSGDNANPTGTSGSNKNPKKTTLIAKALVYNQSNKLISEATGTVTYNSSTGNYSGVIRAPIVIPVGSYIVRLKTPNHLIRLVPGIQTLLSNPLSTLTIPSVTLIAGDADNDNDLDIDDYNRITDCYATELTPAKNCTDPNKKSATDLNDDGQVNLTDVNLFLRELGVQTGN